MKISLGQSVKFAIGLILVVLVRMIPHVPNVEPITATLMPYGKKWGMLGGAVFGGLAVVLYDLATGTLGVWTIFTAGAYILLGILAGFYFSSREAGRDPFHTSASRSSARCFSTRSRA